MIFKIKSDIAKLFKKTHIDECEVHGRVFCVLYISS